MSEDAGTKTLRRPSELPGASMSSVIGWDHPCCFCNYNINGIRLDGACPECGAPINEAIRTTRLEYQPLEWISRLCAGIRLAFIGMALLGAVTILQAIATVSMFAGVYSGLIRGLWMVTLAMDIVAVELIAVGMAMLSWGAPPGLPTRRVVAAMTRTSAICIGLAALGLVVTEFQYDTSFSTPTGVLLIQMISWPVALLAFPFLYYAGLMQLSWLARLIPWRESRRRELILHLAPAIATAIWIVMYALVVMLLMTSQIGNQAWASSMSMITVMTLGSFCLAFAGITLYASYLLGLWIRMASVRRVALKRYHDARIRQASSQGQESEA